MVKKKTKSQIDFPFYTYLKLFHDKNKKKVYNSYKPLTKKFLDFNNPENPTAYLRIPQFKALEIYIFLKEFLGNKYLFEVFQDWYNKEGKFERRDNVGISKKKGTVGTLEMFGPSEFQGEDKDIFKDVFKQIKSFKQIYPNYIFALTMGLGKTVLMATSIFYEFLLANKYPKTSRYCHNALVFAPDKTVLQSLKEIETFDKSKVVPPEYVNWLTTHLKFHFLDDTGVSLNAIEKSRFNIIISNTQKIILKKQHKEKPALEKFFGYNDGFEDLLDDDISNEKELLSNQRFAKLTRLNQLGIYVDEAHHIFGNALAKDFGLKKSSTSLRLTINHLAEQLDKAGTRVVGCYNYTGTPYIGKRLLPEVVYAYGLKDAIDNKYLKQVKIEGLENVKSQTKAFVKTAITEFWDKHKDKRYEGMLPKFAFFASSIKELQDELRPVVEEVLSDLDIPISKILVNVGDDKITSNDEIREFQNLDRPKSEKQFILLVNKGKEGWNCRSLFGVGLHREPKSKVFVLQATMRCLRAITDLQQEGMVYLSGENIRTLENELQQNFNLSVDELNNSKDDKEHVEIRVVPPPVKIKIKRIKKLHQLKENKNVNSLNFEIDKIDYDEYKIKRTTRDIRDISSSIKTGEVTDFEKRKFSKYTLIAEISRYLYHPEGFDNLSKISCLEIQYILENSFDGISKVLEAINKNNEILYDWVIPRIFNALYILESFEKEEEEEIELVKEPEEGFYRIKAKAELIANMDDSKYASYKNKSFHLDNYCFDSNPESLMFNSLLKDELIEKVWFTGMLTHGQSDFLIRYIDPESHTVRSYYPDFLVNFSSFKKRKGRHRRPYLRANISNLC